MRMLGSRGSLSCATKLQLRKVFPGVCFANSNIPEKRIKILKSETELNMLPGHSTDAFKQNNVDRYINRPNKRFLSWGP